MSNRAVARILTQENAYRQIINSTVRESQADFEEMGIESAVLEELQRSWEEKLVAHRVADFNSDARLSALSKNLPPLSQDEPVAQSSSSTKIDSRPRKAVKLENSDGPRDTSTADEDEDAINSDLDDSDDEVEEDGAAVGNKIIALYDKVQRVKTKWKVHLKDGVISVNGRDYLFNRCQGDFEW